VVVTQDAVGAEIEDEPRISLRVKNQPLGAVLSRISQDTGIEFSLDDKWSSYPINDTLQNVQLHQGLKLILRGLNHAIIYESSTSIRIVVYEESDSPRARTYYAPPALPPVQYNEPPPPPEAAVEDLSEDAEPDENTEEDSPESESSANEDAEPAEQEAPAEDQADSDQE
jgi:hypothetical protein